jgi:hypothetical protein
MTKDEQLAFKRAYNESKSFSGGDDASHDIMSTINAALADEFDPLHNGKSRLLQFLNKQK